MTLLGPFRRPHSGAVRPLCPRSPFRGCVVGLLACALLFCGAAAHAQGRGGGPGGGGPGGGMGGGGMGGGRGEFGERGNAGGMERAPVRGVQLGLSGRWWDDGTTAKKLGLRSDQQRHMDDIFETNRGNLVNLLSNLQNQEGHLASLSPKELQDESKVFAAIDRVAQARADLEKANAHVLMQIRQQLDTNQLAALDREIASAR